MPPLVNTISSAFAPSIAATCAPRFVQLLPRRLAEMWMLEALPYTSVITGSIASSTSADTGVVAL